MKMQRSILKLHLQQRFSSDGTFFTTSIYTFSGGVLMKSLEQAVNQHYGQSGLEDRIRAALRAAGKNPDRLNPEDLSPLDQFHTRGKEATLELFQLADFRAGIKVLDVGGGLGGAARMLAAEKGCRVTVLDLTVEYCRVGAILTESCGLSDRVSFQQGSALQIPFPDADFDAVLTQHSSMNVEEKAQLYAEIFRVLRPQGRFALYEVMAGPVQPVYFPVPWATQESLSFLLPAEEVRALLTRTGFKEVAWVDTSDLALAAYREVATKLNAPGAVLPPLGLHLLIGPAIGEMFRNLVCNAEERRLAVIQAVFERRR
jgi:MPBQ/MSBQ methyltransferase